jgi:hypothetical protein
MTRANGRQKQKAAAQAASTSTTTITPAEKRKAARDRKKIATTALQQARGEIFDALTEEQQNALVGKIDEAFSD